jgi:uncharacterized phage protein (predicted DNA packaging)
VATLNEVKTTLRISISNTAFDTDIEDLMEEARHDLKLSGISAILADSDTDPLIKRAIKTYCKANFGFDNPDAKRFQDSYDSLKQHLSLAGDYREVE